MGLGALAREEKTFPSAEFSVFRVQTLNFVVLFSTHRSRSVELEPVAVAVARSLRGRSAKLKISRKQTSPSAPATTNRDSTRDSSKSKVVEDETNDETKISEMRLW